MALTATLLITTIPNQASSAPFVVSGTYHLSESTWTDQLVYEDDNGTPVPIASPAVQLNVSSWQFTHAALAPGSHTVSVKDPLTGTVAISNTFTVGIQQTITVNPPIAAVAGAAFTFSGILQNFSTPPTLTYSLNGAAAQPVTGVTSTGWSMSLTVATAGTYSISVATGAVTSQVVNFTVATVTSAQVISPTAPSPVGTPNYIFYDTFTTLADVTDTGGPSLGTVQTVLAGSGGSFTDGGGNVWTINSANGEVFENGVAPAFSASTTQINLINQVVWLENVSNQWYYFTQTAPNVGTWTAGSDPLSGGSNGSWANHYPFGGSEYTLSANDELEYYTSSTRTPGFSPFSLVGGTGPGLVITTDTATYTPTGGATIIGHTPANSLNLPYNSGMISSAIENSGEPGIGNLSFTYGLVEINAKLPGGSGYWTGMALYAQGTTAAPGGPGEIDIMENGGGNLTTVYGSIHSATVGQSVAATVTDYSQNFHTYAVNWQKDTITWYVDGNQYAQVATPTEFVGNAFYLAINQAIQGNPNLGFDGVPNSLTAFPNTTIINWVRVSQGTTPGTTISAGELVTFTGTLKGYTAAPNLTYTINNGAPVAMTGVTTTGWSLQFNAPAVAGAYILSVSDGTTSGATQFQVGAAAKVITPITPASAVAGQSFTFQGVLAGYTTIPGLTYSLNGGAAVVMTGVSINGWAMTVTVPTAGNSTIVVSDGAGVTGSVSFVVSAASTSLRDWTKNPGQDGSFWVQPFANSANWITTGAAITTLRGKVPSIQTKGNYAAPTYIGKSTDPSVTVTDGTHSIIVHIPLGAIVETPASIYDQSIGGVDATQPYLLWSISGASINGTGAVAATGSVITGTYGFAVQDGSGLLMVDAVTKAPGDNNSIGGIQDYELSQIAADSSYVIQHMLAYQLDRSQIASTGPIWPLYIIDTAQANTGTLPQGMTIGIPANVARPTGQNRAFYALWDVFQQYGGFFYNSGGTGGVSFSVYDSQNAYSTLVSDMVTAWATVSQSLCILNYDTTVSGSQYSLATTKGAIPGSKPAYPAPPLLDLSPTNGKNVSPSTFGAWYPSGYNATPTNGTTTPTFTITPNAPTTTPVVNIAFSFTGSLIGYTAVPALTYAVNGGAPITLTGVTTTGWTTSITVASSGTTSITVSDATNKVTGAVTFIVGSGTTTGSSVTWNSKDLAGSITLSNNNYTATAGGSRTVGGSYQGVRTNTALASTGIILWECTFSAITQDCAVGVSNSTFVLNTGGGLGVDANGLGAYPSTGASSQPAQTVYYKNAQLTAGNGVQSVAPTTVTCVVNGTNFWFSDPAMRSTSGVQWNNSSTANPAKNSGGFSFSGAGAIAYPTFNTLEGGGIVTLNDGTFSLSAFAASFISANPTVVTLSGQSPPPAGKTIQPNTPSGVVVNAPFTFSGTLQGYATAPSLTYSIDGGTPVVLSGVTVSGWSTTLTIATTGTSNTIIVSDGTTRGTTSNFTVTTGSGSGSINRIPAPLTGTVTTGSWVTNQSITVSAMPNGYMRYNYLLPFGYSSPGNTYVYPILFFGHENDEGMNGSTYPRDGGILVSAEADGAYNTVAFRTNFPCIVVVPECDQSLDLSGANGNANFGGYADTPNSGGNEQGINALLNYFIANFSVDPGRRYCTGSSLGAIGTLAWMVDNNQYNGVNALWTAGAGLSDQLYRPTISNSNVFKGMTNVPYLAISTPSDNNPASYDQPAWQYYTGNTTYPTKSDYDKNGMAGIQAGTSQFYYIDTPSGAPWTTFRNLNADGGDATVWMTWMFNQIYDSGAPTITSGTFTPASSVHANSAIGTVAGQITVGNTGNALTGVTYTLSSTNNFKVTSTGQVQFVSASVPANSYALSVTIAATNASNSPQVYNFSIVVSGTTASGGTSSGLFTVSGGQLIAPNGVAFTGRGVAMHDYDVPNYVTNAQCQPLTTLFPGINIVRIAAFSYWDPSTYSEQINWLTAASIVVLIGDTTNSTGQNSGGATGVVYTGTALTAELNWYKLLAQTFTSTYVWFGTDNEPSYSPSLSALYTWQQQTIDAIRGTGNTNIIEVETPNPFLQGALGGVANTVFTTYHNIVFGPHYYSWIWNGNGSVVVPQSTIYSSTPGSTNSPYGGIVQQVANLQYFTSKDGVIPCGCFEFGPATSGLTADASGYTDVAAVLEAVNNGVLFCWIAWAIDTAAGDLLNNSTTSLTTWGQTVATGIGSNVSVAPVPPQQALNAGFSHLVFNTDFLNTGEVASSGSITTNNPPFWYWQTSANTKAANINVQTSITAADVSNGNNGAGNNASPLGGILTLNGPLAPGAGNATLVTTPESTQGISDPGYGSWQWMYIEAYIQFNPAFNGVSQNEWFAWWAFTQLAIGGQLQEVDFVENFCSNFSYAQTFWSAAGHEWTTTGSEPGSGGGQCGQYNSGVFTGTNADANWHTYGCLWQTTGTGTGTIAFYRDNVVQYTFGNSTTPALTTGTGGVVGFRNLELGGKLYQKIGGPSGVGANMNVDWVRIWQAPTTGRNYIQGVYANPIDTQTPTQMGYPWDYTINDAAQDNTPGGNVHGLYSPQFPGYPILIDLFHVNTTYSDFTAAANGNYNTNYTTTANAIAPYANQIYAIRIDSEFPISSFPWSPWHPGTTVTTKTWIAGWRNLALAIKKAMPHVKLIWNPCIGQNNPFPYYPGDDVVDLIGPDVYFQPAYFATSALAWTDALSGGSGWNLTTISQFAKLHNKPMVIPEWGDCFNDGYTIGQMRTWMDANNVVAHSYWDSGDALAATAALPPQPINQAAYVAQFGSRPYTGKYWPQYLTVPPKSSSWP